MSRLMLTVAALVAVGSSKEGDPEPIILKADQSIFRLAWGPTARRSPLSAWVTIEKQKGIKSTLRFWDAEKGELRRSVEP